MEGGKHLTRRELFRLSAIAGGAVALTACAATPQVVEKVVEKEVTKVVVETVVVQAASLEPAELSWAYWPVGGQAGVNAINQVIDPFLETHPGWKVNLVPVPFGELMTKMMTMSAGGDPPDIMASSGWWVTALASKGVLLPLDDYFAVEPGLLESYWPTAIRAGEWQGKRWAMPYIGSPLLTFNNVDMFTTLGLDSPAQLYEDGNWDLNAFAELAGQATDRSKGAAEATFGFNVPTDCFASAQFTYGNGGRLFNSDVTQCLVDQDEFVEGIEFTRKLVHDLQVAPTPEESQDIDVVGAGRMGMWFGWRGNIMAYRNYGFTFDVAPGPAGKEGDRVLFHQNGMCLLSGGKNHDQAWELLKWLTGVTATKAWIRNGGASPRVDTVDDVLADKPPEHSQYFVDYVQEDKVWQISYPPEWMEIQTLINQRLSRVFLENENPSAPLQEAAAEVNKLLQASA